MIDSAKKFETLMFSLNLAEDDFKEPDEFKEGKDLMYYKERENMLEKKIELNDKLKAVHLLKALGVEDSEKRDILSKVDFGKKPKEVFEDVKTAIRDICGDGKSMKGESMVMVVKPWQRESTRDRSEDRRNVGFQQSRNRSYERNGDRR